ncbi:MAG: D-2-hydroxyacid dehydrogenase [Gemmatimonadaceae bacterium]
MVSKQVVRNAERVLVLDLAATSRNWALPPAAEQAIRAAAPAGWRVRTVGAPTSSDGDGAEAPSREALEAIADAEIYFGFGITRPLFLGAAKLRWVHSAAAGVRGSLFPEMLASPVLLTNSAGIHAVPIAETVVGGLLYLLRGLDMAVEQQREGRWDKSRFVADDSPLRELSDCRVLVLGTGGIGSEVARRLAAFGARCVGIRRRPERGAPTGFERVAGPETLDEELGAADVVVVAAPLTPETTGALDAPRVGRLARGAIVVNVARGALVDENAVAAAVATGRLRGAVLDVFREEPLAADSPLWQLRSVLITPHVSPVSPGRFWPRQLELFLDNWRRYVDGAPLRNLVDKRAGY